jgi:hypothetical protein
MITPAFRRFGPTQNVFFSYRGTPKTHPDNIRSLVPVDKALTTTNPFLFVNLKSGAIAF